MKAPPKRKGNSYPKLARNHAAETGALREPRGGYTQNYTLHPHLPTHSHLTREETMRATRHVPVKHQALAQIQDPRRVLHKRPGGGLHVWEGLARFRQTGRASNLAGLRKNSASNPEPARAQPRRTAELALRLLTQQALTSQRGQTRHRTEILLLVTTGQHLLSKHLVKRHTRRHNRQVLVVQAVGQHHKT